jgi:hypothetical protein
MGGGVYEVGLGVDHENFGAAVKAGGLLPLTGVVDIVDVVFKGPLVEGVAVACQSNPSFTGPWSPFFFPYTSLSKSVSAPGDVALFMA